MTNITTENPSNQTVDPFQMILNDYPNTGVYVSSELDVIFTSKLNPSEIPSYEIHNGSISDKKSYKILTPLLYLWIKQQMQSAKILYQREQIPTRTFSKWRSRYVKLKRFMSGKISQNQTIDVTSNDINLPEYLSTLTLDDIWNNYNGLRFPHISGSTRMFHAALKIFPRPVSFGSSNSTQNTYTDKQMDGFARQITPQVYARWMEVTQKCYPELCNNIPNLIVSSYLWVWTAYLLFLDYANVSKNYKRYEGLDYRLCDLTLDYVFDFFDNVLKQIKNQIVSSGVAA